jgi:hypothetical protein
MRVSQQVQPDFTRSALLIFLTYSQIGRHLELSAVGVRWAATNPSKAGRYGSHGAMILHQGAKVCNAIEFRWLSS